MVRSGFLDDDPTFFPAEPTRSGEVGGFLEAERVKRAEGEDSPVVLFRLLLFFLPDIRLSIDSVDTGSKVKEKMRTVITVLFVAASSGDSRIFVGRSRNEKETLKDFGLAPNYQPSGAEPNNESF